MKNTIRIIIVALLIINSSIFSAEAQDTKVTRDLEQWTSVEISKKLGKRWNISLNQEFRFIQDVSRFDVYFADLGVDFKLNKHFSIGANYRLYQNKNNDGVFKTKHRWNADFQYKHKISQFKIAYRLRFQNKDEDFFKSDIINNMYSIRNKLSANYNIRNFKLDPFVAAELYSHFNKTISAEFNKLRWTAGLKYSLNKFGDLELFYRIENELNQTYNKNTYIIGLGYKIKF